MLDDFSVIVSRNRAAAVAFEAVRAGIPFVCCPEEDEKTEFSFGEGSLEWFRIRLPKELDQLGEDNSKS